MSWWAHHGGGDPKLTVRMGMCPMKKNNQSLRLRNTHTFPHNIRLSISNMTCCGLWFISNMGRGKFAVTSQQPPPIPWARTQNYENAFINNELCTSYCTFGPVDDDDTKMWQWYNFVQSINNTIHPKISFPHTTSVLKVAVPFLILIYC